MVDLGLDKAGGNESEAAMIEEKENHKIKSSGRTENELENRCKKTKL